MSILSRFRGVAIAADEAGNAILGPETDDTVAGNPHYTMSQRWGLDCEQGDQSACAKCRLLTKVQNSLGIVFGWAKVSDHCAEALKGMPLDIPTGG